MTSLRNRTTLLTATAAALLLAAGAAPAGAEELTVPLSDPGRPAEVEVKATFGAITVEAYDGRDVLIEADPPEGEENGDDEADAPEGMRRIPNRSFGLTAEEEDNRVAIKLEGYQSRSLHVLVPRQTSVRVKTVNGGDLAVRGVEGEHELSNVNGGILAEDVSGTVVAHTTNGAVTVTLARAAAGAPMSFVTLNGDVDVTFPPGFAADLRLKTTNGEIYTDFDFEPSGSAPQIHRDREGGSYRVEVHQEVRGSINGGGAEVRMQTMNGDVLVRQDG